MDVSGFGVEVGVDVDLDVEEMTFQKYTLLCIKKKGYQCGTLAVCICLDLIL